MENRKLLKKITVTGLVLLYLFLPLWLPMFFGIWMSMGKGQWLYFSCEGKEGRVVDAATQKPIEGAIVVANWGLISVWKENPFYFLTFISPLFVLNQPGYPKMAKEVVLTTDKNGEYKIPAWKSFQPLNYSYCLIENDKPFIEIYKPGYEFITVRQDSLRRFYELKMSLNVEDIEKNYNDFFHGIYTYSREMEWVPVANLIKNVLTDIPEEARRKILKDINELEEFHHVGGK